MLADYIRQIVINLVAAPTFVYIFASVKEPFRRRLMVALLVIAAIVYLGHGLGYLEVPFAVAIALLAIWGRRWYPAIGIGWLLHTLSDVIHHLIGHPMVASIPLSSFGCAMFDPLIAIWFFAGAPSVSSILGQNRTHDRQEEGGMRKVR